MSATSINYAKSSGMKSVPGAAVLAVVYLPLFGWFVRRSFVRPTRVHFVLSLFCLIRVVAFAIRAVLAGSESAGENLNLLIADDVLFGVGFFGLLYSAYSIMLDRELFISDGSPRSPLAKILYNRRIFHLIAIAAVVISIVGSTELQDNPSLSRTLRKASTIVFLGLTVLLVCQTVLLVWKEQVAATQFKHAEHEPYGLRCGAYILSAISSMLLLREVFNTVTLNNFARQNNEHLWYPFVAIPEIVAVFLYAIPGLVPANSELPK